jgi:hypothetical protein
MDLEESGKWRGQSDENKAEWQEAGENWDKRHAGEVLEWDQDQSTCLAVQTGYRMTARYPFVTVSEFTHRHKVDPKSTGLKVVSTRSECGTKKLTGVLIRDYPAELTFRTVEFFSDSIWTIRENLVTDSSRLRAKEPKFVFDAVNEAQNKNNEAVRGKTSPRVKSSIGMPTIAMNA